MFNENEYVHMIHDYSCQDICQYGSYEDTFFYRTLALNKFILMHYSIRFINILMESLNVNFCFF